MVGWQKLASARALPTIFWALVCVAAQTVTVTGQETAIDFNRDVRPLLSDKCFFCHGPDDKHRGAGLRLDIEEEAKDYAVVEGDPSASELIERIFDDDPESQMPPPDSGKVLSDVERELLRRWIEQGAAWSEHWAYVPPVRHQAPAVDTEWPLNWIDQFVLERMPDGLQPNPQADRITLIRRLYFDLLGLPPTPAEVQEFLTDDSADAYERLVDRLLDSPHYGERMAMYWFDLVRYADTVGYHGDQDHNISPYRDWVINAFNDDMPFDQFTREQLAGDLLESPTVDQQIATGYNRLLQTTHEGGLQAKEYITIYAADRVRNVSAVWMGATLGCAQCHDHKYDPYTARDFYAMSAFFADVDDTQHFKVGTNALPTKRPPEIAVLNRPDRLRLAQLREKFRSMELRLQDCESATQRTGLEDELAKLQREIDAIEARRRLTMVTVSLEEPRVTRVLPRGNWLDESGEVVEPAIPEFLGQLETNGRATRLDLANWLVDPRDGSGLLTARVMANRMWYLMIGEPIAADLADFGGQGSPPVAPRLLDALACELVDSNWQLKKVIRAIVTSRTYRQSSQTTKSASQLDPDNQWFARATRYRLPAEVVRDSALAISGLLVTDFGGRSVKPYQPAGHYRHLNFPPRRYKHDQDSSQYRRGVYVHWQRQFLHPMLRNLDAPMRVECTAARPRSNTPLAALTLLNDPSFVEAARSFAERIVRDGGEDFESRLRFAFAWALSREPDRSETKLLRTMHRQFYDEYTKDVQSARQLLQVGLADSPDEDLVQIASWTMVARALFNLNETITRN